MIGETSHFSLAFPTFNLPSSGLVGEMRRSASVRQVCSTGKENRRVMKPTTLPHRVVKENEMRKSSFDFCWMNQMEKGEPGIDDELFSESN